MTDWHLHCSACDHTGSGDTLASVCPRCGQPLLVRYDSPWPTRDAILPRWVSWFGFVAGVAAIASVIFFTMLLWLLWVGVASVALFLAARSEVAAPRAAPAPTS